MIPCMCWVQEGQIPDETAQALQGELTAFAERSFGAAAFFNWLEIRKGNGFTCARPSTSSIVVFQSDKPLSREKRTAFLSEICDIWMNATGCSINEIVATVRDPQG